MAKLYTLTRTIHPFQNIFSVFFVTVKALLRKALKTFSMH